MTGTDLRKRERDFAWELRTAMVKQTVLSLALDPDLSVLPRVRGTIVKVATSDAFVLVQDGSGEVHVPCAVILSIRRPHFTEPLDAEEELVPDVAGQMRLEVER